MKKVKQTIGYGEIPDNSSHDDYDNWNSNIKCDWNANGYRLPTEVEWEYAARGGDGQPHTTYSGGDDADTVSWNSSNSNSKSHTVGTKDANVLGIYDMSGNVEEWCWDWHKQSYTRTDLIDPRGPDSGAYRRMKGGSFSFTRTLSDKPNVNPSSRGNDYGFRIVCGQ